MSHIKRRFRIGETYAKEKKAATSQEERNAAYSRFRAEVTEVLGLPDGHLPGVSPGHECAEAHGTYWVRQRDRDAYTALSQWNGAAAEPAGGVVMCECGNRSFSIDYGDYECFATCSECGKRWSVYSG